MDETTQISKCCGVEAHEGYDVEWYCPKCKKPCEVEEVCAFCLGTGEVTTMERVYPNEPHMAPIGTETCLCKKKQVED